MGKFDDITVFSATIRIDLKYGDLSDLKQAFRAVDVEVNESKTLATLPAVTWLTFLVVNYLPLIVLELISVALFRVRKDEPSSKARKLQIDRVGARFGRFVKVVLPSVKRGPTPESESELFEDDRRKFVVKVDRVMLACQLNGERKLNDFYLRFYKPEGDTLRTDRYYLESLRSRFRSECEKYKHSEKELREKIKAVLKLNK